jgi:hypothetical protein
LTSSETTIYVPKPGTRPPEDRSLVGPQLAAVADGVTRIPPPGVAYPSPSPSALAADVLVDSIMRSSPSTAQELVAALASANTRLAYLNHDLGYSELFAARIDDLAGTVGAAATTNASTVDWVYIADCGVALITAEGALRHISPDDIAPIRPLFPSSEVSAYERMWTIRDLYRNTLGGPGFGVLTGEPAALRYIRAGHWPKVPGDCVAVFSDGCRPLILREDIRRIIVAGGDAEGLMNRVAASLGLTDEVSAVTLTVT